MDYPVHIADSIYKALNDAGWLYATPLPERLQRIYEYVVAHPGASTQQVAGQFDMSEDATRAQLSRLLRRNKVVSWREGRGQVRQTHWTACDEDL